MYERENEQDFEEVLQDGLRELIAQDGDYRTAEDLCWVNLRVQTFSEDGVMTRDKGLVISLPNGREYQLTIIRSR
ncbi:hypothetical protein ACH6CV_10225 [Bacillota bacterium Meth-B3]